MGIWRDEHFHVLLSEKPTANKNRDHSSQFNIGWKIKSCQLNLEIIHMFLTVTIIDINTKKNYAFSAICRRIHLMKCRSLQYRHPHLG